MLLFVQESMCPFSLFFPIRNAMVLSTHVQFVILFTELLPNLVLYNYSTLLLVDLCLICSFGGCCH